MEASLVKEEEKELANKNRKQIRYTLPPDFDGCTVEKYAILSWDENIGRWIARSFHEFLEGYERGSVIYLEHNDIPFEIDNLACREILQHYNVPPGLVKLKEVPRTSPSELERIALNQNVMGMTKAGKIEGVAWINRLPDGRIRYSPSDDNEISEVILEKDINGNWKRYERDCGIPTPVFYEASLTDLDRMILEKV